MRRPATLGSSVSSEDEASAAWREIDRGSQRVTRGFFLSMIDAKWIGLRENFNRKANMNNGKIYGFL